MRDDFGRFSREVEDGLRADRRDPFLDCFRPLDSVPEEEARWVIPGWMPEEQITLLAADGGMGKTSLWVSIAAALSCGSPCLLDPPGYTRKPLRVAFCTTEDSVSKKLKRKLREAGADESGILCMDLSADRTGQLRDFKFGSPRMGEFVRHFRPDVCIFDPVQGFIPPEVNMGSRNAMRDCMAPLVALGEEVGVSFLVVCHTNKRKGAYGRDRIADSADLWDIARSVWMAGSTEEKGLRYLSNEKNNYAPLQETRLFSVGRDGQVAYRGTSRRRDRDYQQERETVRYRTRRDDCKEWILRRLEEGPAELGTLELSALEEGYSQITYQRAKAELVNTDRRARSWSTGFGSSKRWHIGLVSPSDREK